MGGLTPEEEDYVLANAPEFIESMREADRELAEGKTVTLNEILEELRREKTEMGKTLSEMASLLGHYRESHKTLTRLMDKSVSDCDCDICQAYDKFYKELVK